MVVEEDKLIKSLSSTQWIMLSKMAKRDYPYTLMDKISLIKYLKTKLEDKLERKINIGGNRNV